MAKIPWVKHPIETVADDGTILKGVIDYWAKDYSVRLLEPIKAEKYGSHLMYMIPVSFIVDESTEDSSIVKNGSNYRNIYPKCKKMLQEIYEENK